MEKVSEFDQIIWDFVHKLIPDIQTAIFFKYYLSDLLILNPFPFDLGALHNFTIALKLNGMYCIMDIRRDIINNFPYYSYEMITELLTCDKFVLHYNDIIDSLTKIQALRNYVPPAPIDFCKQASDLVRSL